MPRARTIWMLVLLVLLAGGVACVARSCGPSELAKAHGPYDSKLRLRLDDEGRFWNQLADLAQHQSEAPDVEKYRAFLETRAAPYYSDMESALRGIEPGHPRLVTVHEAVLAWVKCKQAFVALELKRLADTSGSLVPLAALEAAYAERDEARHTYLEAVADDFPDGRLAALTTAYDTFMADIYRPAVDGKIEPDAAVEALRKRMLAEMRRLRDERFEDSPRGRLFRKLVVATHEYFIRVAETLPVAVRARQATKRVEEVQAEMDSLQKEYQRLLREVQRDR